MTDAFPVASHRINLSSSPAIDDAPRIADDALGVGNLCLVIRGFGVVKRLHENAQQGGAPPLFDPGALIADAVVMKHFHDVRISATSGLARVRCHRQHVHGPLIEDHEPMRTRDGKTYRRKSEAETFRVTLMLLRRELGWTQEKLATRLGVSARTLSSWENGYWLPPVKGRLHFLLALRDVPPAYVLAFADQLGVSSDPAHDGFLQPFRDAVDGADEESPEPGQPPVDPAQLKSAVDGVVREVARTLGAKQSDLRAGVARVLGACIELGATIDEVHEAVGR